MIDKNVSTRDDPQDAQEAPKQTRIYMDLVRGRKKRKKKKKRTRDKCTQTKERKATQTLAIVLGTNIYTLLLWTQQFNLCSEFPSLLGSLLHLQHSGCFEHQIQSKPLSW